MSFELGEVDAAGETAAVEADFILATHKVVVKQRAYFAAIDIEDPQTCMTVFSQGKGNCR